MQTTLTLEQDSFILKRFPIKKNEQLQAWDAADQLVLNHLAENLDNSELRVLIINDQFGALSVALSKTQACMLSDSYIAQQATLANLALNNSAPVRMINSTQALSGQYDLVIIKVQKSLAQLEDQLHKLRQHLHSDSQIIGCAMVKMIHSSTLSLFEKIIGPTKTSLAKKKARLIFSQYDNALKVSANPYPQSYLLEPSGLQILNHANVFSRARLDIGCRYFIEHIPSGDEAIDIIDLGCGNGIVGIIAAQRNPKAQIHFYDESHMAVASAEHNYHQAFNDNQQATFQVTDCLGNREKASADLILNNPPFHQQNAIGDFIAWQMFSQALLVLKKQGELWVIGNRHLDYQNKLVKLFGNCQQVHSNNKFVILKSIKK
ncbi:50S rRNA methyltransferase ['Osedax' symbiont bacterium Rs2_46_30_T18]|nr:50S rRNA methyltransferase ['Osedax' symbiont bacterium Rs2_46_30_T18]